MKIAKPLLILIVLAAAVLLPIVTEAYFISIAITILTFMTLALSWDMMLRTGQLSFGTAGFFGLGGYTGIIAAADFGVDPVIGIMLGGLVAGGIALILGMAILRLRGLYFAITTMALASVFMVIIRNLHRLTGGPSGKIVYNTLFNYDSSKVYWFMLAIAVGTVVISELFQRTRIHFAIDSICPEGCKPEGSRPRSPGSRDLPSSLSDRRERSELLHGLFRLPYRPLEKKVHRSQ